MKNRVRATRRVLFASIASLAVITGLESCSGGNPEELTYAEPYKDLVGSKYRVVADDLYAYGTYRSRTDKSLSDITLIPGVGIAGSEIAFRKPIPKGQILRIQSAWRKPILFGSIVYYIVEVEHSDFPGNVPVEIELARGNQGIGADLNPRVFRKIEQD